MYEKEAKCLIIKLPELSCTKSPGNCLYVGYAHTPEGTKLRLKRVHFWNKLIKLADIL